MGLEKTISLLKVFIILFTVRTGFIRVRLHYYIKVPIRFPEGFMKPGIKS